MFDALVAPLLRVDERPLEVQRLGFGVLVSALDRAAHGVDLRDHGLPGERYDRGEERRDAVPGEDSAHFVERVLPLAENRHRVRSEPVDVRVDEAGQPVGVFKLHDL